MTQGPFKGNLCKCEERNDFLFETLVKREEQKKKTLGFKRSALVREPGGGRWSIRSGASFCEKVIKRGEVNGSTGGKRCG